VATTVAAAAVYFLVPEAPPSPSAAKIRPFAGLRDIYADTRFWRLAPLSASTIGTAWALQGLSAAPWLAEEIGFFIVFVARLVVLALGVAVFLFQRTVISKFEASEILYGVRSKSNP
jgi:hypothetical protein